MAERISLLAAMLVLAGAAPTPEAGEPGESTAAPETSKEQEIGVEEAIRLAIDLLDRLETGDVASPHVGDANSRYRRPQGGPPASDKSDTPETLLERVSHYIEIVRADDPVNPFLPYLHGRVYAFAGRQGDAVEQLRKFVRTREGRNEWRAYRILGDLFVVEFPRLAKANYEKAAALNADEPSVLFGLSVCAFKFGAAGEAISKAREALAADGRKTIRYVSHLAILLKAAGSLGEARREAEQALRLAKEEMRSKPGVRAPLLVVNVQYQLLVDIMQARLAQAAPERSEGAGTETARLVDDYLDLATYLRVQDRIAQMLSLHAVLSVIEDGVDRTSPDTPPALLEQYGIVLAEVGGTEAAIAVFEKLLKTNPNNPIAAEQLRRLRPEPTDSDQSPKRERGVPDQPEQP